MKRMKHTILQLSVCAALVMFGGCYNDDEETLYPVNTACDTSVTTYSAFVSSAVSANCAISGCHVAGAQAPDLSSYSGVKANVDRIKVRAVTERTMPPASQSKMSECDVLKLKTWIDKGAQNN